MGSVWEFLYPILGGTSYETEGECDLFGCPCGDRESRRPCRIAVTIVTIRRRTELYTLEDRSRRMGLNVISFCRSGVRAAWELIGEGESLYGEC